MTGGASGLGREIYMQLSASDATVIVADIDEVRAQHAATEIAESGGRGKAVRTDVTDSESVRALV